MRHLAKDISAQLQSQKAFWLAFASIVLLAVSVRFFQLGQVPVSLYWDEAAMLVDVKSVVQTGKDMHGRPWYQVLYPSYGDYKLPVYIWLASLSGKMFGVNEWSLRLPSAVAGVGTVIVAGLIARTLAELVAYESAASIKRKTSTVAQWWQLSTMVVVAISPWAMLFSRTAFEGHVGQFLLACSIYLLLQVRRQPWLILGASFVGALATYSYFSVRFVWPVVATLVIGYCWWRTRPALKNSTKEVTSNNNIKTSNSQRFPAWLNFAWTKYAFIWFSSILLFGLLLLPMQLSPLYKDSNAFRLGTDSVLKNDQQVMESNILQEQAGNTKWGRIIYHRYWLTLRELLANYSDNVSLNFLFLSGDPNLRHGTGAFGLFVWPLLLAWLIGLYQLWQKDKVLWLVLVGWWLVALLPASVPQNTPHALRSLNALVPLSLIIGLGLVEVGKVSGRLWRQLAASASRPSFSQLPSLLASIMTGLYFGALSLVTLFFVLFYFTQYPRLSASDWQDGYKQLAEALLKQKQSQEEVWILPFDDRFYLWVMGYGSYSGHDFQTWKSIGFQFPQFDGYHFQNYSHDQVAKSSERLLLAGRAQDVTRELTTIARKPKQLIPVQGYSEQSQFLIAEF